MKLINLAKAPQKTPVIVRTENGSFKHLDGSQFLDLDGLAEGVKPISHHVDAIIATLVVGGMIKKSDYNTRDLFVIGSQGNGYSLAQSAGPNEYICVAALEFQ